MPRKSIWKEAYKLYLENKIEFKGSGNDREFWDVAGHGIELRGEKSGQKILCNCKNCTIFAGFNPFCSFRAALITHLVMGKKDKK